MKKLIFIAALALVLIAAVGCDISKKGNVVATVNGQVITSDELDAEMDNIPSQYKMFMMNAEGKKRILDSMITRELVIQEADKEGLTKNPEIQAKIKEYEDEMKRDIETQIISLKKQLEKLSDTAKKEVLINEVLKNKDYKDVQVSDKEIQDGYSQYVKSAKAQDPNAQVKPLSAVKDQVKLSVAREKWLDALKATAKININENELGAPPMTNEGANLKLLESNNGKQALPKSNALNAGNKQTGDTTTNK